MRGTRVKEASVPSASEAGAAAQAVPDRARRPIGVFVVAALRLYRDALAVALEDDGRFRLTGTAPDVTSAVAALRRLDRPPRVLLLDHAVAEGVAAVRPLLEAVSGASVIAVAVDEAAGDVISWVEAGAAGFVPRDASLDD